MLHRPSPILFSFTHTVFEVWEETQSATGTQEEHAAATIFNREMRFSATAMTLLQAFPVPTIPYLLFYTHSQMQTLCFLACLQSSQVALSSCINNCLWQKLIAVKPSLEVIDSCFAPDIYKLLRKMPCHSLLISLQFDLRSKLEI